MYRGNGIDKIGTEVRNSYLAFNLNHFLGSYDILCQYSLNLADIFRLLVDILYDKEVRRMFRGGIC